jgi:protocatechuate 3,4-dioxygenase beta subunit
MTRTSRNRRIWPPSRRVWAAVAVALALASVAAAILRGRGAWPGGSPSAAASPGAPPGAPAARPPAPPAGHPGEVAITGRVFDAAQQRPVDGAEVVFRGVAGDVMATTRRDGGYALRVAPGTYRALVRGAGVMSIGRRDQPRVPDPPPAELAGVPDEALLTAVVAARDTDGVDLAVVRGGSVAGRILDRGGQPVGGAVVHAVGGAHRPALGTDIATSADDGGFELQLPPGVFELAVSHPRFAGIASPLRARYTVGPGTRATTTLILAAGCIVAGRVIGPDGAPAGDGALELQLGPDDAAFAPSGRLDADGAFRWATTADGEIGLRAWPWKAPPSEVQHFRCRDGARFEAVEFALPDRRPDLEGVLVDAAGRPVRFAFLDLRPLAPDGIAQQERTDDAGRWEVHSLPPGRYRIIARAAGGVVSANVVSPHDGIRLELSGTGRLEGVTPRLASGSFELALDACIVSGQLIPLPQSRRLVTVTGGRFAVDGLPACGLKFSAIWRGRPIAQHAVVPVGGTAEIELPIGELHDKTVHGVVRDAAGQPVAGAAVIAAQPDDDAHTTATMTDTAGRYTLRAASGATVRASAGGQVGDAQVGGANIDAEQVDLVLGEPARGDALAH